VLLSGMALASGLASFLLSFLFGASASAIPLSRTQASKLARTKKGMSIDVSVGNDDGRPLQSALDVHKGMSVAPTDVAC
ncbi:hypothetical protein, partial [Xanthomonas fragariae]|uniref:hypothetical protein n=1 Tax=Xanthomonas fragariae TaxID=48664 RepID=UPI00131EF1A8